MLRGKKFIAGVDISDCNKYSSKMPWNANITTTETLRRWNQPLFSFFITQQ